MDKGLPPSTAGMILITVLLCLLGIIVGANAYRGVYPIPIDAEKHPPTTKEKSEKPEHKGSGGGGMF